MKRALLALILALPLVLSAQFRIVGTGLFTTLNDSTYRAKIDFRPDLTGNSYNATQLNDSMLVLSQKGQLYRLDSFYNASFSSAFIIVVEKNGNWGSPVGQVMVFQNNSSLAAPQAVYGANGATAGMQAGVDTWNALLLKVVSDSAVYWNQAYSNSIDSLNVSGDSLKTITLYRASGDSISATFVDGGGSGPVTDTLYGEVKGPLDSTYIDTVANIIFRLDSTTVGVGEVKYNDTQGSIQQGLKGGNVTNVIGQQIHQRVTNATGAPLTKGTAVFLHGSQGNRITVRKALATVDSTSANTFGIVAESIANNQSGYVITEGLITNINTNALTEGAAVYLSPTVAGELTTTKPQAPQHTVYIGVCVKQNAGSGELFVKIRNGQELDELHDVRIDSPVSNASLYYNTSEGIWRDTTAAALKSDISGTTNYLAKFTGSNAVGNSQVFDNGTNVGIGDETPQTKLHISVDTASGMPASGTTPKGIGLEFFAADNRYSGLWFGADIGGFQGISGIAGTRTTGYNTELRFYTNNTIAARGFSERMRIDASGNVGLNTTTPAYRLDVNGDVNTTGMYKKSGTDIISGTTNYIPKFTGTNTIGNSGFIENGQEVYLGGTANAFNFSRFSIYYNPVNNGFPIVADTRAYNASPLPGAGWNFGGKKDSTGAYTAFGAIQGAKETSANSEAGYLQFSTNGDGGSAFPEERMRITSAGNVGIATSSPSRPLHVAGTTAIRIPVGNFAQRGTSDNGDIRVRTDTASMEYYSGAWRTVAPMARVPQSGLANRFSKFDADGLLDTSAVLTQSNGRIGINATPTEQLQVGGTVRATRFNVNTFSTQVLSINNYAPAGSPGNNIWIGNGGQSSSWTAGNTGSLNISIGNAALLNITTGYNNLAIGFEVAKNLTTGFNNVGFGNQAFGLGVNTGYNNLGIGSFSLYNNSSGYANVGVGPNALEANTSGSGNLAFGSQALYRITTGYNLIGIGSQSGYFTSSGANNQTSFNSIYIGSDTRPSTDGNNNEIVIGPQAIGQGSNTTTIGNSSATHTVLQYGETLLGYAASGDVGDYRVQVNGNGYVSGEFRIGYTADQGNYPLQVNGQIFATNATIATSDARLKQDIEPLKSGLKEVLSLNPVTYTFKPNTVNNYPKGKQVGFLAQEIKATVQGDYAGSIVQEAGGYLGVADTKLIPLLVKAIQEQQAQIEALKKEIEALKNK